MSWPKGRPRGHKTPGSGRKKGSPQKIVPGPKSPEIREMVLRALDAAGGEDYLLRVAIDDPKPFLALIGRLIPSKLEAEVSTPEPVRIEVVTGFDAGPHDR